MDALSRAHHLRVLHRAVEPENVLLAPDGTAPLTDFRLAAVQPRMVAGGARRALHPFELAADERAAVARIRELVQGMPLGLVLAASSGGEAQRTKTWSEPRATRTSATRSSRGSIS